MPVTSGVVETALEQAEGVVFATTGFLSTAAGGRGAPANTDGECPSTLAPCGATRGAESTVLTALIWLACTLIATCWTGRAVTSAFCGTATSAPGTLRFA